MVSRSSAGPSRAAACPPNQPACQSCEHHNRATKGPHEEDREVDGPVEELDVPDPRIGRGSHADYARYPEQGSDGEDEDEPAGQNAVVEQLEPKSRHCVLLQD
jgi:hypothetical protein